MRVIFKTAPAAVAMKDVRDGSLHEGQLHFELVLCEQGEDPTPPGSKFRTSTHSLGSLRTRATGGTIEIPAPPPAIGAAAVRIPESVVSALPDSAPLVLQWQFTPRSAQ